ncbi:MAG: hypothetical protein ACXU98_04335 [Syntrophales bacterium]
MKVAISSLDDKNNEDEIDVSELNYDYENNNFWMHRIWGDDWFQRVNSSLSIKFVPRVVRFSNNVAFVVFDSTSESDQFKSWLKHAEEQVREGYRTMRG